MREPRLRDGAAGLGQIHGVGVVSDVHFGHFNHGEEVRFGQAKPIRFRNRQDRRLVFVRDGAPDFPRLDGGNGPPERGGERTNTAKSGNDLGNVVHTAKCTHLAITVNRNLRTDSPLRTLYAYSMQRQPVTEALKELREAAGVGVREMARELGMSSPASYKHYEDPKRFKAPYLPMAMAQRFAEVLETHGSSKDKVLSLAGAEPLATHDDESIEARMARLSPGRQHILHALLSDLEAAEAAEKARPGKSPDGNG